MRTTLLQTDIIWAQPEANHRAIEALIDKHPGSDLYVLPEMFSTGFATVPDGIAEEGAQSLKWMIEQAGRRGCAIAGSVATAELNASGCGKKGIYRYYNRFYFVKPDGSYESYDKVHLFTYSGENERYEAGQQRTIVEYKGVRILLQVCYDLRFPAASRNRWLKNLNDAEYDVAIYVASWPTSRLEAWTTLLHARAIENQCYVIGVDRTGNDPACSYSGGSEVVDPYGQTIAACERGKVDAVTAEINMNKLKAFRKKFPVLKDQDKCEVHSHGKLEDLPF